jgi:hypothetical protein
MTDPLVDSSNYSDLDLDGAYATIMRAVVETGGYPPLRRTGFGLGC